MCNLLGKVANQIITVHCGHCYNNGVTSIFLNIDECTFPQDFSEEDMYNIWVFKNKENSMDGEEKGKGGFTGKKRSFAKEQGKKIIVEPTMSKYLRRTELEDTHGKSS